MCDKMAISAYILKIVEKNPFLRLQMRANEMFYLHQFLLSLREVMAFNYKRADFGFQVLDLKDHFSASLNKYNFQLQWIILQL